MKNKKIMFSVVALGALAAVGLGSSVLAASTTSGAVNFGRMHDKENVRTERPNINSAALTAKRAAAEAAILANDYNAWVKAEGANSPILTKINADNFSRFVEAHNLKKQSQDIMKELGLEQGAGQGQGMHRGFNK